MEIENKKNKKNKLNLQPYFWIAIFMIFIVVMFYIGNFYNFAISKNPERWGNFGDYIGGVLNPILAFLSFLALLKTIQIQNKELRNSRKELKATRKATKDSANALKEQSASIKLQIFENTFYNLIDFHHKTIKDLKFIRREVLSYVQEQEKLYYKKIVINDYTSIEAISELCNDIEKISNTYFTTPFNKLYNSFYNENTSILNKYLYTVQQVLSHILSYEHIDSEKIKYANIYKSQLSQDELKLLFYSCAGVNNLLDLKTNIEKLSFFDSLLFEKDNLNFIYIINKSIYTKNTFGSNYISINNILNEFKCTFKNIVLIPQDSYSYDKYLKFVKYCCYLEKYTLGLDKLNELLEYINKLLLKPTIYNIDQLTKEKIDILDFIKIIKKTISLTEIK